MNKMGIASDFRQSAPVFRDQTRRAIHKGDATTLRAVSAGFAAIEPGELARIDEKWPGRAIDAYGSYVRYGGYAAVAALLLIAGLFWVEPRAQPEGPAADHGAGRERL